MPSPLHRIERARPLLGTSVSIRVGHAAEGELAAQRAIDHAFAEIAAIHRLMSFQDPESDISRLNRGAFGEVLTVHPATFEVLHWAGRISEASEGCFNIAIAPQLVTWGMLPAPDREGVRPEGADWRDVELLADNHVRFRRPLWIDVSGIAKGYAVDRAIASLLGHGILQATVNAGGDLRICGAEAEGVELRTSETAGGTMAMLEVENAAVASSSGHVERRLLDGKWHGPHVDGRNGEPAPTDRFVAVVAPSCLIADALTKPVMILEEMSAGLLRQFDATAHVHDAVEGWRHFPGQA